MEEKYFCRQLFMCEPFILIWEEPVYLSIVTEESLTSQSSSSPQTLTQEQLSLTPVPLAGQDCQSIGRNSRFSSLIMFCKDYVELFPSCKCVPKISWWIRACFHKHVDKLMQFKRFQHTCFFKQVFSLYYLLPFLSIAFSMSIFGLVTLQNKNTCHFSFTMICSHNIFVRLHFFEATLLIVPHTGVLINITEQSHTTWTRLL